MQISEQTQRDYLDLINKQLSDNIPGLLIGLSLYIPLLFIKGFKRDEIELKDTPVKIIIKSIPGLLIPIIIIFGIYGGIFTPTEAGSVAVIYAVLLELLFKRNLSIKKYWQFFRKALLFLPKYCSL